MSEPTRRQVLGLGLSGALLIGMPAKAFDQAEIEDFIGVALPHEAQDVLMAEEAGIDRMVRLRFDAPAEAATTFAAAVLPKALTPDGAPTLSGYGGDIDWWLTGNENGLRSGAAQAETENLAIMVAQMPLAGARIRTWLMAFSL